MALGAQREQHQAKEGERVLTIFTMFMGAFLGYFFGLLNQARLQRQATYYEVMRFVAEYREFTTEHERPDAKFRASYFWVNRQVHDRFSAATYRVWREVEKLVTFDAKLPSGVTQTEYDAKRDQALNAMQAELRTCAWLKGASFLKEDGQT